MDFFEALWNDIMRLCGDTIALGDQPITTLNLIVWSLFIGFMIGIGVTIYNKFVLGALVRELIEHGAHSEEAALTAAEVGCANPFIRFALRENSSFRRVVRMKGDTPTELCKESFKTARYFIPDENVHRAEVIYGGSGTTLVSVLLSVLAFLVVAFVSFIVVPDLIQMLANFIAEVTPASNIL